MKDLERYQLTTEEILGIKGGITYCNFMGVLKHLGENGHQDQKAVLTQQFIKGDMQLEDWDYSGNPPEC